MTAKDGVAGNELGESVAISGNTIVAGVPGHKVESKEDQGAADVFVMPPSGWIDAKENAQLTASDGAAKDTFGDAVAIAGNTVVAGAPLHEVGSEHQEGAAYVFTTPASGWSGSLSQNAELTASDGGAEDGLGDSVAVSGGEIVVGDDGHEVGSGVKQGDAYVFTMPASGWAGSLHETAELTSSDGASKDAFGVSAAVSGSTVVVGALSHQVGFNKGQGAAYVFGPPPVIPIASPPVGVPAPVLAPLTAPVLSGLSETAKRWREGSALAHVSASKSKRKKLPLGTTFSFSLDKPASVTFTFTAPAGGRRVGKRCVAQTKKNKRKHRCTRTVVAGTLSFAAHAGRNKVRFEGRISKHRKLKPGSYTLLVTATASGKRSASRTLRFTIAK